MELNLLYQELSNLTYYLINLIIAQIVGSGIFKVDKYNNIKPIIGGKNKFQKTSRLVISILCVIFGYYIISRVFDEYNTAFLLKFEYLLIPLFISVGSFFIFYLVKVNIRRCWGFHLVKLSIIPLIISTAIFGILLYYFPPESIESIITMTETTNTEPPMQP